VGGEDGGVGSVVDGGYAMVGDHVKVRGTPEHPVREWSEEGGGRSGLMVFNVSKRVESERKRVNHQRLRLSCPGFHVWVVELNLYHEAALCPATDILASFSEHGPPLGNRVPPDKYWET